MLTEVKFDFPPEDCPWIDLVDQDGNQLVRIKHDEGPDEVLIKVAKAICDAAGIKCNPPY